MGFQKIIPYKNPRQGARRGGGGGVYWHLKAYNAQKRIPSFLQTPSTANIRGRSDRAMVVTNADIKPQYTFSKVNLTEQTGKK